ncbi:MAG: ShlB/FhaC/HecB family hemolysin secretion/activation protein [Opitutales bacterium]|nr:ShlB/FhaC/HecB family hemolysin secretion/activation protein [Opitutales bacterium]
MKSFFLTGVSIMLLSILTLKAGVSYRVVSPNQLKPIIFGFLEDNKNLSEKKTTDRLKEFLIKQGFTFAQVSISETAGVSTLEVKPGFMGKAKVTGNEYLGEESILDNLSWNTGEPFNYSKFHSQSSRLNKYRFVQVDSKLKPVRGHNGEVQVDANFNVKDQYPISPYVKVSNDGTDQSSGWRSTVGFEVWESFLANDRINFSYTLDPKDASQLSSYFASYQFSYDGFSHSLYAGYSDSEYENVTSSSLDMDIAGDGFFAGYSGLFSLDADNPDSLAFSFGVSYLDLSSQIYLGSNNLLASDEDLSLFLPRVGFQGKFSNPGGLQGSSFWSIGVISDVSSSDEQELIVQNPEIKKGFYVPRISLVVVEPITISDQNGGIKLKIDAQSSNKPLPTSLKKSIGGMSSIRGYREREAYGDSGISMNFEYSLASEATSIFGLDGNLQKVFFYDAGYVSNEGLMAAANDSVGMQSFGAGLLGNFEDNTDISLQVGVPITDTLNTSSYDARAHFSINFRF